jgi:hypothetical protein
VHFFLLVLPAQRLNSFYAAVWRQCVRVKEEIGAQADIDFSPLLGDGLTLGTLFSCLSIVVVSHSHATRHTLHAVESLTHSRPLQQGVVDSEEEDQEQANDEPSEPEDDNEIDILADMLARQGNRRATADSDEEYEGW